MDKILADTCSSPLLKEAKIVMVIDGSTIIFSTIDRSLTIQSYFDKESMTGTFSCKEKSFNKFLTDNNYDKSIFKDDMPVIFELIIKNIIEYFKSFKVSILEDNFVMNFYNRDCKALKFLIQGSYSAATSSRANTIYIPSCDIPINELTKHISIVFDVEKFVDTFESCATDTELSLMIGIKSYKIVRFIIESNLTNIGSNDLELSINVEQKTSTGETILHSYYSKEEGIRTFAIKYPSSIEDKFCVAEPEYFFHGSGIENWHSILRNGIKNCSGTKLQVNGAAFGSGVYLGANAQTSLGYCSGNLIAMGVVQVLGDYKRWMKTSFLVVSDDSVLLLRYIILYHKKSTNDDTKPSNDINVKLTKYFRETLKCKKKNSSAALTKISTKRINGEIARIKKKAANFTIEKATSNHDYIVTMNLKGTIKTVKVRIKLPEDYPSRPPKIAIESPQMSKLSGMIDSNGAVIIKELCNNQWKSSNMLIKIMNTLYAFLESKNFTLKKNETYDFDKAIDSFYKYQSDNGWH